MIEILCVTSNGKQMYRRLIDERDVIEVVEGDNGNADIRFDRCTWKTRCWISTAESFDDIKKKLEEAKTKRFRRHEI